MRITILMGLVLILATVTYVPSTLALDRGLEGLEKCEVAMKPGGLGGLVPIADSDLTAFCNAVRQLRRRVDALEKQEQASAN